VPPGWGRSGRSLYYTAGLPPDDPQRESDAARALYPVTGTYRVNIETGGTEKIALGDFACVSPDEEYVLVYPAPKLDGEGKWVKGGAKVLLETKKVTYLPDDVRYPRISPSGKLAACLSRKGGVRCFQTADCKPYGRRVPKTGFNIEEWFTDLRWIVVEQEGSN